MTNFTEKELDNYWQDTQFNFPLKESINEMEKLDVYLVNLRIQRDLASSKSYPKMLLKTLITFIVVFTIFWSLLRNPIVTLTIATIVTVIVFLKLNSLSFFAKGKKNIEDIHLEINKKDDEYRKLRANIVKEVRKDEIKKTILQSVKDFEAFIINELSQDNKRNKDVKRFIDENKMFKTIYQELITSYEKNDYESVLDILAEYAMCDYEIKQEWKELKK